MEGTPGGKAGPARGAIRSGLVLQLFQKMRRARGEYRLLLGTQRGGCGRALLRRHAPDGRPAVREGDGDFGSCAE
jgi:hypothetical protein